MRTMRLMFFLSMAVFCAESAAAVTSEFAYPWAHPRLVIVQLMDDTDAHDELYFEKEYLLSRCEKPFDVTAPAIFIEDSLGGDGMAFFRQAPLPHARSDASADWRIVPGNGKVAVQPLKVGVNRVNLPKSGCLRLSWSMLGCKDANF